jgi:cytochrome c oxidase subunit II
VVDTRHQYNHLSDVYLPIALVIFAIFAGAILFAVLRYRQPVGGRARGPSDAPIAEFLYVVALAGIVALLVSLTFKTEAKVDRVSATPGLEVNVLASKWQWRFSYPAYGISIVSSDVRPATFYVPTDETVRFRMTSLDVIHSLYIPALRFKRDAFPRKATTFDLVFDRPRFMGQCAEFCGLHHADMRFSVEAMSPSDFRAWASQHRPRQSSG